MSKEEDDLIRRLWNIRIPMAPDRFVVDDEYSEYPEEEEPLAASPTRDDEDGAASPGGDDLKCEFNTQIPLSQAFQHGDTENEDPE